MWLRLAKVAGQDQGIGLRDEDQRVVDDVFVGVVEIVVAEAAVAGHIDGDDEQLALSLDARLDFRFDHRRRGAHLAHGLHALQHVLVETGVAGRDLELRLAGDPVHGVAEGASTESFAVRMPTSSAMPSAMPAVVSTRAQQVLAEVGPARSAAAGSSPHVSGDAGVAQGDGARAAFGDAWRRG